MVATFDYAYQLLEQVPWVTDVRVTFGLLQMKLSDLKCLIGEQWGKVYPADPSPETVVHPQVLRMLHTALLKLSAQVLAGRSEDLRKDAEKRAKESLREQVKRQRRA